jgi:hypothetical protein
VKNTESHCDTKHVALGVCSAVLTLIRSIWTRAARPRASGAESPAYIKRDFVIRVGIIVEEIVAENTKKETKSLLRFVRAGWLSDNYILDLQSPFS